MQASDTQSTAQTNMSLIAAPASGKQVVVYGVYVSSDTAQTVSFESQGTKEVATVDRGTSTGGTFTLTVDAQTTGNIAFDANAATVDTAVEALSTVTSVTVTGTGTTADPWVITFDNPIQDLAVSGSGAGLTGGDSTLTVTETTAGVTPPVRWRQYVAANGGQTLSAGPGRHLFTCLDGKGLTYTSSASGNIFVSVDADIRSTFDLSS